MFGNNNQQAQKVEVKNIMPNWIIDHNSGYNKGIQVVGLIGMTCGVIISADGLMKNINSWYTSRQK